MKKQLTVFAAAALVASFASAALAATPSVSMTGKFDYTVEYNITDQKWANGADNLLLTDPARSLSFSVATTGDPNIGTVTFSFSNGSGISDNPAITMTGGFYGGTLKLGQVAANWDALTGGTDGAGAEYAKTFDAVTLDVVTAGANEAAKVNFALSDTNNIYGGFAANNEWLGTAFVGGKFVLGDATVEGKFATEIKDDKGTGLWANAVLKASDALTLTGTFVQAEHEFANAKFADFADTLPVDHEWNKIGWAAINPAFADGANIRLRADLVAIKDAANVYAIYKSWANDTWAFVGGTNYAPLSLTKAEVTMDSLKNTKVTAEFGKTLGTIGLNAYAGYQINSVSKVKSNYGYVKASKSFAWLSTWASVGVHDFGQDTAAKVGANASFAF